MKRILSCCVWSLLLGFSVGAAFAQTKAPSYPRINLATTYTVDPTWPQRRADAPWGQMPGIAIDKQDNVWIYTRTNPTVQVYAPDGHYLFGWRNDNPKAIAHFLRIDSDGNVWMADAGLHVVTKSSPQGQRLLTLGTEGVPGEDASHFDKPTDMAFAANGDIFVADGYGNNRIVHFDKRGRFLHAWGKLGSAPGQFSIPHSIAIDSKDRIYVADRNNVRVQVFNKRGKLLDVWPNVLTPWGIWITPKDEIWICGSSPMPWVTDPKYPTAPLGCPPKDQLFVRFAPSGRVSDLWTLPKGVDDHEQPGDVNWLHAIAFDSKGNVYLGDIIGKRVQKFVPGH